MLKNQLVQVNKWEIFTTSKIISDKLEVPHHRILKVIDKIILKFDNLESSDKNPKFKEKFIETNLEHWKTKIEYKWYLINEPWFTRIVMHLKDFEKAFEVQGLFIQQFFQMKEALQNQSNNSWIEARKEWKALRREETDVIKQLTDYAEVERGRPVTYPLYSTYTKMTNKHLQFIVDCKEWKPIRDLSWIRDLGFIMIVDDRCKNVIIDWMNRKLPYKEIYREAKEEVSKLVESLDFKPKLECNLNLEQKHGNNIN